MFLHDSSTGEKYRQDACLETLDEILYDPDAGG